ncbi:helix-turn-helix domain-containing protein [Mycobacteroides abscessus subsp. abscessus]|uniref:helix-turn-helix domain-containing protein n=1 Tax=Mycobacteroides abscessus TaxID=36809 RepID=UPI0039EEA3BC
MSTTTVDIPAYLTTADLARRLRRSEQTIRLWVADAGLPAHRVKRRLYFHPAEVDAWMRTRDDALSTAPADHRAVIKRLVDAAPELTVEQAERIRLVLTGGAA